ncbi:MAG: TonB-dependent receptor [Colwellia sp.]|nr:TonB-dependent receptor [Colwellia sp.]
MKVFKPSCLAMAVCSTLLSPIYIYAAEQNANTEKEVEKIVVTGSRIKGVDLEGTQPLVVISAEDIRNSGASSISELMKQISQTRGGEGSFSTSESGATSTSTPAGQAAASLRGLGPSSTLTLINGRRVAASSFASGTQNFVDINSIPLAAIERIEVLATGASAIYGADAVAGVINYILKKDYQGAEVNLSYGNSFESSNEGKYNLNLVMGTELAGGNLTVFADYYDREAFSALDRDFTQEPLLVNSYSYLPKHTPNIYYNSSDVADADGNYLELANPNCKSALVTTEYGEDICAYYRNEDDMLNTELTTASLGFMYSKEIGDIIWDTDFFYSHSKSTASSSPAPINQLDDSDAGWAPMSALDAVPSLIDLVYPQYYYTNLDNSATARELRGIQYDARFATPRTIEVETNSFRLVSSLSGDIGDWEWESAITLSKSESEQKAIAGIYNRYKYTALVNGELCGDGSIAEYDYDSDSLACGSGELLERYNPFLEGNVDNDSLLAMSQEVPTRDGESTVYGWDARVTGELFEFNDQVINAAFGIEARKEEITDIPSLNARARAENDYLVDVFGFGSSLSAADRFQWGAFAEFHIPLNDMVELQLAGRYDDYDDFGDTFNPKIGITIRPIDDFIFRASWSTSFRAPSLTQAGVKLRTTTATYDCGANQAVADLYCGGDSFESSPNVLELGNANLRAEESESISIGFAYSPSINTTVTVDYWQFHHDGLVDTDMTAVLANAITDESLRHCGLVPVGETGISYDQELCDYTDDSGLTIEDTGANLTQIKDSWIVDNTRDDGLPLYRDHIIQLQNTGEQNVSGIDLAFDHKIDFSQGTLSFAIDATHYLEFERNKAGSSELEKLVGTWRYPENIASARISWSQDALYSSLTLDYTSSYQDDIEGLRGRQINELDDMGKLDANGERDVESWLTLRANIGYDFKNMNINLTINNLLDEEPPVAYGSSRGFDSLNHDALGANYRVSMTYFF